MWVNVPECVCYVCPYLFSSEVNMEFHGIGAIICCVAQGCWEPNYILKDYKSHYRIQTTETISTVVIVASPLSATQVLVIISKFMKERDLKNGSNVIILSLHCLWKRSSD